jgi:hypothetical protein
VNNQRRARAHSKRWWIALGLGAVAAVYLVGATTWIDQWRGMRDGNAFEEFYWYMAQQLHEPSICDKISWAARLPGGFFLAPSYERSGCYAMVAGRDRNPWSCLKVRRLGAQSLFDSQLSMVSCLLDAAKGLQSGTALSGESLVRFFRMMGYEPDELQAEGVTRPIVDVRDIYPRLSEQPDIAARVGASLQALELARASTPRDTSDAAYLADLAALAGRDAGWCQRIPEDLPLAAQKQHFRDWCLFTLATNLQDGALCQRIPIRPYPIARAAELPPEHVRQINLQMSMRAQCERQVHSANPHATRYGPEVPSDDEQTRRLIVLLGYPIPRASELPVERLADAYGLLLTKLTGADASLYAQATKRLIERVKALPDINWNGAPVTQS